MSTPFRYTLTRFASEKRDYTSVEGMTADSFVEAMLKRGHQVGDKDGSGIIGARFKLGSRLEQKNVVSCTALILDVDGKFKRGGEQVVEPVDPAEFLGHLPFRGVAHTSYSASPENQKFRVILPLEDEISPADHLRLWYWTFDQVQHKCDPVCKNPDRMFYLPRAPREMVDAGVHWVRELSGPTLSMAAVPSDYETPAPAHAGHRTGRAPGMHLASPAARRVADHREVLAAFMVIPLVTWAKERASEVSRESWRGIATNLAAIVAENDDDDEVYEACLEAFIDISSEDLERFDRAVACRTFADACNSVKAYGPMTFDRIIESGAPDEVRDPSAKAPIVQARNAYYEKQREARKTVPPKDETPAAPPPAAGGPEVADDAPSNKPNIDEYDPAEDFLYDMEEERYLMKNLNDVWILPGYSKASFDTWLMNKGLQDKQLKAYKANIPIFHQKAMIYNKPFGAYCIYRGLETFNIYQKSDLEPRAGKWDKVHKLLEHLVDGDAEGLGYLIQWLAAPVQSLRKNHQPLKNGTAIVLHGEEGSGKGTLQRIIDLIYGETNTIVIGQDAMDSKFNGELVNRLFVVANEVMSSTNRGAEVANKLKMWISDKKIPIEEKFRGARIYENTFNIMFTSNDDYPVVVGPKDRRFTVFHSTSNRELCSEINEQINGGDLSEVEAFLHHLMTVPLTIKVGDLHSSSAKLLMQEASLPSELKFVHDLREDGWLAISMPWAARGPPQNPRQQLHEGSQVLTSTLNEVYADWCRGEGVRPRNSKRLAIAVKKAFPSAKPIRVNSGGTTVRAWEGLPMRGAEATVLPFKQAAGVAKAKGVSDDANFDVD